MHTHKRVSDQYSIYDNSRDQILTTNDKVRYLNIHRINDERQSITLMWAALKHPLDILIGRKMNRNSDRVITLFCGSTSGISVWCGLLLL